MQAIFDQFLSDYKNNDVVETAELGDEEDFFNI
jgi:hypothetical protein